MKHAILVLLLACSGQTQPMAAPTAPPIIPSPPLRDIEVRVDVEEPQSPVPRRPVNLAICFIEWADRDRESVVLALVLTKALKDAARNAGHSIVGRCQTRKLNCDEQQRQCMAATATNLGADHLLWGRLDRQGNVEIKAIEVTSKKIVTWSGTVTRTNVSTTAKSAIDALIR